MIKEWIFPSTRYQGSKRKLLPWIYENVRDIQFESVLDLFGGSGIVCYMFKKMGKRVTYNDYLKFNCLIGKALIENSSVTLSEKDLEFILDFKETTNNFIQKTFSGVYYTDEENVWIDNVIQNIHSLKSIYSSPILENKIAISYYALFQSCMIKRPFNLFHRNNLKLRTADVERKFGNKTTWEKPFEVFFRKFIGEINNLVFSNGKENKAIKENAFKIQQTDFDLIYMDPPYFSKDRSPVECDYSRMYHFLEGMANYNVWHELIDYDSVNLRFKENGYAWKEKKYLIDKFEQIFSEFRNSTIVLSYKSPGIPTENELISGLKKYKKNVQVHKVPYKYALNKSNGKPNVNIELLIIGR
jgi:adenine-specific DNA methylase